MRQRVHQSRRIVLALRPISQASAEQRCGRAGRLGPGICYRLWEEHGQLEQETIPEIRREDLTQFVLTVASTGYRPQDLAFLDAPPDFAVERAQTAPKKLGCALRRWHAYNGGCEDLCFARQCASRPITRKSTTFLSDAI